MKEYKYLYRKMLIKDNIREAYRRLRKGKTKRKEIKYIDEHLDEEVERMYQMILNTKPEGVEVPNPELAFKPKKHRVKYIFEHGKERKIYIPDITEQWLHHLIVLILEPIVKATAYPYSCGSFPGRGAHYAKRRMAKWIQSDKGVRYFAKLDIRHFYNNIRLNILMKELRIRIKDEWFLYIIYLCLEEFKKGIPLGYFISQWLANYLLEPLDWFINKVLKFNEMERYMDDIVILGNNKKLLHKAIVKIKKFLGRRFRLKLKRTYQVCKFYYEKGKKAIGRFIDYMGFVFKRNRVIIRKSIMLSATRLARRLMKRRDSGKLCYIKHIKGMLSYMGWYDHTNSYNNYEERIKPCVKIRSLKRIVSKYDRRVNNESMERGKMLNAA